MTNESKSDYDMLSLERRADSLLRPRGKSVAFKFLKATPKDLEKISPPAGLALCQVMKLVNIYGTPVLLSKAYKQACADGEHVLGFRKHPEALKSNWSAIFGMAPEFHDRLVSDILHADFGVHEAALFSPLGRFKDFGMHPDGLVFNVNSIQAELLILGTYLHTGKKPAWSYNGYAACEIVAAVAKGGSPWAVVPCLGARSFCSTQDDEIWFGLSLPDLSGALDQLERNGMSYPPGVEQAPLSPPQRDHLITRLMSPPE